MKTPTTKQVIKLLEKNFGWENLGVKDVKTTWFVEGIIEDTISVIMEMIEKNKTATNKDL